MRGKVGLILVRKGFNYFNFYSIDYSIDTDSRILFHLDEILKKICSKEGQQLMVDAFYVLWLFWVNFS